MPTVVVGVDGSPAGARALRFAAEEARLRGAVLRVVHAWSMPLVDAAPDPFLIEFPGPTGPEVGELIDAAREGADAVADRAVADALETAPGIEIERELVEGPAADALVECSEGATLLVVGSHGHGRLASALLGSTSSRVIEHAPCPVVVVRG